MRSLAFARIISVLVAACGAAVAATANANSPIGSNLWFFRDWVSEYSTIDAFKMSRPWITHCMPCNPPVWDTGEAASLDSDDRGWLRSLPAGGSGARYNSVGTLMLDGFGAHYPAGQYTVTYDGQGTIAYGRDAVRNAQLSVPGRDVIDVRPAGGGIWLYITSTDPDRTGNYIRNIRVIMPGFPDNSTDIFHTSFLEKLKQYRLLRVTQWMETNGSTQIHWNTRTRLDDARWNRPGSGGVPVEALVALANRLSADLWVNMPHQADDEYMASFAALVRDSLAPNLKIWVEYSNEVWNGSYGYTQSTWVQARGQERWSNSTASAFTKQMNWHGMRTAQMCDTWKSAFGNQSGRVVCVMGSQSANPWTGAQALDCPLWTEGAPCSGHGIDVLAGAPYFGGYLGTRRYESQVLAWTADPDGGLNKLFAEIGYGILRDGPPGGALSRAFQEMSGFIRVASDRGLGAVAYEGGTHFASETSNPAVLQLFAAASRDPRMGVAYDNYLAGWRARGGRLFNHYFNVGQPTALGVFGAYEYMDSAPTPKSQSIQRYIQNNPCWWADCAVPEPVR